MQGQGQLRKEYACQKIPYCEQKEETGDRDKASFQQRTDYPQTAPEYSDEQFFESLHGKHSP